MFLQSESNKKPIHMYINSPGKIPKLFELFLMLVPISKISKNIRWLGYKWSRHIWHHAIHNATNSYMVCWSGSQHGFTDFGSGYARYASFASEFENNDSSAVGRCSSMLILRNIFTMSISKMIQSFSKLYSKWKIAKSVRKILHMD